MSYSVSGGCQSYHRAEAIINEMLKNWPSIAGWTSVDPDISVRLYWGRSVPHGLIAHRVELMPGDIPWFVASVEHRTSRSSSRSNWFATHNMTGFFACRGGLGGVDSPWFECSVVIPASMVSFTNDYIQLFRPDLVLVDAAPAKLLDDAIRMMLGEQEKHDRDLSI